MPLTSAMPPAAITGLRVIFRTCGTSESVPVSESSAGSQEARTMPARVGTRRHDQIHACLIECGGLFQRRRGSRGQNAASGTFAQDFGTWDAKHETEHRRPQIENHLDLLLKAEIVRWLDGRRLRCRDAHKCANCRKPCS
jgi:hypothetical protein